MLNKRELATVLAALRYWQRHGLPQCIDSKNRIPEDDVATAAGALARMLKPEIDALCERLNAPPPILAVVIESGFITGIVSDQPEAFCGVRVFSIDYDTDGMEKLTMDRIDQGDGTFAYGTVAREDIDRATINLAEIAP